MKSDISETRLQGMSCNNNYLHSCSMYITTLVYSIRYVVEKEVLYMYILDKDRNKDLIRKRRIIVKEEEKQKILSMCHDGIDGMHFGHDKMYGKASYNYRLCK